MAEADREGMYGHVGSKLPAGRVGEASDIAEAYLYLMRAWRVDPFVIMIPDKSEKPQDYQIR